MINSPLWLSGLLVTLRKSHHLAVPFFPISKVLIKLSSPLRYILLIRLKSVMTRAVFCYMWKWSAQRSGSLKSGSTRAPRNLDVDGGWFLPEHLLVPPHMVGQPLVCLRGEEGWAWCKPFPNLGEESRKPECSTSAGVCDLSPEAW